MFDDINFVAVAVAAVVSFFIGMVWYSFLFSHAWMKLQGVKDMGKMKSQNMMGTMAMGFVSTFVMVTFLSYFMMMSGATNVAGAVQTAFLLWLGFYATSQLGKVLWEGKKVQLYLIDTMYYLVILTVSAAILAKFM